MSKLRTARGWLAGLAGVALLLGGVALASNMGFKFVPNIAAGGGFNLSLPWNNNYAEANDLLTDTGASKVSQIEANSTFTSWFGSTGVNFAIEKGKSYMVYADTGGALTPVIVGSHDPNYSLSFINGEAYNAAAPYHQTLNDAKELLDDLNANLGGAITKVSKVETNSTFTSWFGSTGVNFNLDLGMGVVIYSNADTGTYAWPHY